MTSNERFRWGRGVGHALLFFVLAAVVIGIVIVAVRRPADPAKLGEGLGRFGLFALLWGLGFSYALQRGKKLVAGLIGGLFALTLAGLVAAIIVAPKHSGPQALTDAERQPLVSERENGATYLAHRRLRFRLRHPGPTYVSSTEHQQLAGLLFGDPRRFRAYVYAAPSGESLIIGIVKGGMPRSAYDGLRSGFVDSLKRSFPTGHELTQDQLTWSAESHRLEVRARAANRGFLRLHAHRIDLGASLGVFDVILVASTFTRGALDGSIDSFRPTR